MRRLTEERSDPRRGRGAASQPLGRVYALLRATLVAAMLTVPALGGTPHDGPASARRDAPQATPATDSSFTDLELASSPDFPGGTMAVVAGEAGPQGHRFRLGGLTVMQPVLAYLVASDPDADVRMMLLKPGKEQPSLTGGTEGEAYAFLSTRTWGGLDILVESPQGPARFALVVWVSDELTPNLKDVVVTPAAFKAWAAARPPGSLPPALAEAAKEEQPGASPRGTSSTLLLVLGAFFAGGVLVLLTVLVMRRTHG